MRYAKKDEIIMHIQKKKQPTQNISQWTQMLGLVEKTSIQLFKNMFKELKN